MTSDARPAPRQRHHPQFGSVGQQAATAKLGMWVVLVLEALLFCSLLVAYAALRVYDPVTFSLAREALDPGASAVSTLVLITGSLSMALAVRSAYTRAQHRLRLYLGLTAGTAGLFLAIRALEYVGGLQPCPLPGNTLSPPSLLAEHCRQAVELAQLGGRPEVFFGLYYTITGMHGFHVLIALGLISWLFLASRGGRWGGGTSFENVGLYWHMSVLIWVFVFPLLYVIR